MKTKKIWISLAVIALVAPTVILCFLVLTADDFSLKDFSHCAGVTVTDADGQVLELAANEDSFLLLTRVLSIAETNRTKVDSSEASWLYTVKSQDGQHSCRLGVDDGQAVVEWKDTVYALSYPRLTSSETAMYPCLVRYGVKTEDGYLDAPILSQRTDIVYSIDSPAVFSSIVFDSTCKSAAVEILLYAQDAQEASRTFYAFKDVVFDESVPWTVFINAELIMNGYRVQCSYEFFYLPD